MIDFAKLGGWVDQPESVQEVLAQMPRPTFTSAAPRISGAGAGKTSLIYKAWKDVNGGSYVAYPAQTIGDCVGHGFGRGVDLLSAVDIALHGKPMRYEETSTEAVYGLARVQVGERRLGNEDGAVGAWAARAVSTIGTIARDLVGPYDGRRSKIWGYQGMPEELVAKAAEHRVRTVSLVQTYEELEDAIANGYPVPVCSTQGFTMERDADGFCAPRGTWAHCMLIVGVRNDARPGACIFQSWGPNVPSGPLSLDQPDNSFWVDRDVVARMLAMRDSWALSRFDGYPARELPASWTYAAFA
ncbi:MAG: hypothetical protein SFX72_04900 [Isosphaeraceae bacterium]|nr:hypothetical protein [Isosphaeraceae bacterium]